MVKPQPMRRRRRDQARGRRRRGQQYREEQVALEVRHALKPCANGTVSRNANRICTPGRAIRSSWRSSAIWRIGGVVLVGSHPSCASLTTPGPATNVPAGRSARRSRPRSARARSAALRPTGRARTAAGKARGPGSRPGFACPAARHVLKKPGQWQSVRSTSTMLVMISGAVTAMNENVADRTSARRDGARRCAG